jgi:hypothetical protein
VAVLACAIGAHADTVIGTDGARREGQVVSVDAERVLLRVDTETVEIPRSEVASIHFDPPAPALRVELRNVQSDDSVDVLLEDQMVLSRARDRGEWIDLTRELKDGNNALRLRIHNDRSGWAYHLELRINGRITELSCGRPYDLNRPCRCCGKQGSELGVVDDLPTVWINVDRELGRAELLP